MMNRARVDEKDVLAAACEAQGLERMDQIRCAWSKQAEDFQSSRLTILPLSASTRRRRDLFTVLITSTS